MVESKIMCEAKIIDIDRTIKERINKQVNYIMKNIRPLFKDNEGKFIIAGGCLTGEINDIDCFPLDGNIPELNDKTKLVCTTKNSRTFTTDLWPIQLCNYQKTTLRELVESFDFAHIQLGVVVELFHGFGWQVCESHYTEDYLNSLLTQSTYYCNSDYPLSSLIRAQKYYKKGIIKNQNGYVGTIVVCLADVIKRGVGDYEDFKDQLDSIDLATLPEDLSGLSKELAELYELLLRK